MDDDKTFNSDDSVAGSESFETRRSRMASRTQQEQEAKRVARAGAGLSTTPLSSPKGMRSSIRSNMQDQESSESSENGLTPTQTRKTRASARSREEMEAKARAAVDGTAFRSTRVSQDGQDQEELDKQAKQIAGAFRVIVNEESGNQDSEKFADTPTVGGETILEAVVAPDLHEEMEAALQSVREAADKEAEVLRRRVTELEQARDPEKGGMGADVGIATAGVVVAVADGGGDGSFEEAASKRKIIGLVLLVLAIAGGAAAGVLMGGASDESAPGKSAREIMLKDVLADHAPFNEDAFSWLAETDTWEPPEDSTKTESLWAERYAMAALYHSTKGNSWTKNDSWLSAKGVCEWFMRDWDLAHCSREKQVTRLELWQDNLSGSIPSELGILTELTFLSLRNNNLGGTIPNELGHLTNLVYLNFHVNSLSGIIPEEYGSLTGLTTLHMHDNILTGTLPTELGTMVAMTDLELYNNGFTGTVPTEFSRMTELEYLYLYVNKLTGTIPELPVTLGFCLLAKTASTDYEERNCFANTTNADAIGCDLSSNCVASGSPGIDD